MNINLKLSSKMHLFIIISCIVIALGLAMGTIFQVVSGEFFNYSDNYSSYKSVTVSYEDIDFSGSGEEPVTVIQNICKEAFGKAGVSSYLETHGSTTTGGKIEYKFTNSVANAKLEDAVSSINAQIKSQVVGEGGIQFSYASYHTASRVLGDGWAISLAAITAAAAIVFHFVYFVIRYKLTMALGALLADVHNIALYTSLLALCRVPVGVSIATFGILALLITIIGTCFYFDRMRKNCKNENLKKLSAYELADKSADESLIINTVMPACLAVVSVLLFALMSISSLSPLVTLSAALCSLVAFVSCAYGTAIFTPAVYSRIKQIGDKYNQKKDEAVKTSNK